MHLSHFYVNMTIDGPMESIVPKRNSTGYAKRWCFTLNNPICYPLKTEAMDYLIYQLEEGENKTPHLQGYVEFMQRKRLGQIKNMPGWEGMHLEVAKGKPDQNKAYCSKEPRLEGPYEFGHIEAVQGKRKDLDGVYDMIKDGATLEEICDKHPLAYIKYYRGIQEAKRLKVAKRHWKTRCTVIIGGSGMGKSHMATNEWGKAYLKSPDKWWDDYDQDEVVVMDEFHGNLINLYLNPKSK